VSNANAPSAAREPAVRGKRGTALLGAALVIGTLSGATAVAQAQSTPATPAPAAAPAKPADTSLTMYGVTLYGTVDLGLQFQNHGAPSSDYFPVVTNAVIQKNSRESITTIVSSALSQSKIGLQGKIEAVPDWYGVFKLETFFNPDSGNISDGLKSLTVNNGRDLCVPVKTGVGTQVTCTTSQSVGVDSSIAGQLFNSAAYLGFTNKAFGTITVGRQNGLLADGIGKYDPQGASNAFSLIGFSGTAAGGGDTEDRRLDRSVKYYGDFGLIHAGAQYQFNHGHGAASTATELDLGVTYLGGSLDVYYAQINDAVAAASLSSADVKGVSAACAAGAVTLGYACAAIDKALKATISDNSTIAVMGSWNFGGPKLFGGFEHITFKNPSNPVFAGADTIGGYVLVNTNNLAFPQNKINTISWLGLKWPFGPKIDLTGAFYYQTQNAYAQDPKFNGCSNNSSALCSGHLSAASLVAEYRFAKRFTVYGGMMWSAVYDGLANGYIYDTNTINPTVGVRLTF